MVVTVIAPAQPLAPTVPSSSTHRSAADWGLKPNTIAKHIAIVAKKVPLGKEAFVDFMERPSLGLIGWKSGFVLPNKSAAGWSDDLLRPPTEQNRIFCVIYL
jgi:hypothetical protein